MIVFSANFGPDENAEKIRESCSKYGYRFETYGKDMPYINFRQVKIDQMLLYLKSIKDKIVCYVDAHDSWMLKPGLFDYYKKNFKAQIVLAGNRDHYPHTDLYQLTELPKSPTSFKYICSSQFIGYRTELIKAFEIMAKEYDGFTDQEGWHYLLSKKKVKAVIDNSCELFLNMTGVDEEELTDTFYFRETKTRPFNIHFGGPKGDSPNGVLMNKMYEKYLRIRI